MAPVIPPGCFVLVTRLFRFLPIREGQQLLINHPSYGVIVKTVTFIDRNKLVWCKGENEHSVSVVEIGPVRRHQIIGRVIKIFKSNEAVVE